MNFNIFCDENNGIKNLSVIGEIDSNKKSQKLLSLLDGSNTLGVNITFLGASMLCTDIVEKLSCLQKKAQCKIFVLKRNLYLYLHSLGIRCEYVSKKHLCERDSLPVLSLNSYELVEEEVAGFLHKVHLKYGYDYTGYQIESIKRRIKISMLRENIRSFEEFKTAVLENIEIFEQMFMDFSINTTEFFRDPEIFLVLRNRVLPYLNSHAHIKIWSVGCSNGKEAYSLAILLDELGMLQKTQIYATDINHYIIEEAKNGLFSTNDIDKDIINYKKAGGIRNFIDYFDLKDTYMRVNNHLKSKILFFQHSLVGGSGILNEFQLILCRNVLIYFRTKLQENVLETFYKSLDIAGFLMLGKNEGMLLNSGNTYFTNFLEKEKIFRPK